MNEEMKICAAKVSKCACAECSRYEACKAKGRSVSGLARFLAKVDLRYIPLLEDTLLPSLHMPLKFKSRAPHVEELYEGAYAVLVMSKGGHGERLAKIYLDESETFATFQDKILREYMRLSAKRR